MSPIRPERIEDSVPPAAPTRQVGSSRAMPITGPADVRAQLDLLLAQSRRRGAMLALLCIRIDAVARSGEPVDADLAQRVREEVSHRIGHGVRSTDAILRESDSLTCVVLASADAAIAAKVGQRLQRLVDGDYRIGNALLQVTVRIGEAAHPGDGLRATELLRQAAVGAVH